MCIFLCSCASELEESLKKIALLNADLSESKRRQEEATRHSSFLKQELTKSESQCASLKRQVGELTTTIEDMKEQSINVLEEQLQKVHELEDKIKTARRQVAERDSELERLKAKINSMSEQEESLKSQVQDYDQLCHDKLALQQEKDLLQQVIPEKELCIETLEQEVQKLKESNKDLAERNTELQQVNCESTDSLTNLDQELQKVTKINEDYEVQTARLQETMHALQEDNDKLKDTVKEIEVTLKTASQENQSMKVQHESEVCVKMMSL